MMQLFGYKLILAYFCTRNRYNDMSNIIIETGTII